MAMKFKFYTALEMKKTKISDEIKKTRKTKETKH